MSRLDPARLDLQRLIAWPLTQLRRGILHRLTTTEIFLGGFGLVAALVTAALLSPALGALPGAAGDFAPIGMAILLAPVGIAVALGRRAEIERMVRSVRERTDAMAAGVLERPQTAPRELVLDTSAIIDGRLEELVASGFVLADLVVPRFVLEELRRVADSSDALKRQRGRRGLELLSRIQASEEVRTSIDETPLDGAEVDAALVSVAQGRGATLLLTDSSLERVAEIQGVRALNLHTLAEAVRTSVLSGEELPLEIHEAGQERAQGVGYLSDGTMVVVEEARALVGQQVTVVVRRTIQTKAGRMVFAELTPQSASELLGVVEADR